MNTERGVRATGVERKAKTRLRATPIDTAPEPVDEAPRPRVPTEGEPTLALDLEGSVPVLLTFLVNRLSTSGSTIFRKRFGIGLSEWKVLSTVVVEPGCSGARVAQLVGMDRAAVSRAVKALAERKLVAISEAERHGNYQELRLTRAGRALHNQAILTAADRERLLLANLDAEERRQLVALLHKLLDQMPAVAALAEDGGTDKSAR